MGPIAKLLGMLPGMGQMTRRSSTNFDEREIDRDRRRSSASMTPAERANPKIINGSRRLRIANGSGVDGLRGQPAGRPVLRGPEDDEADGRPDGHAVRPQGFVAQERPRARRSGRRPRADRGPTPPKARSPFGARACPTGFPDLSNMPKGLDELPPGLADIDLSKLKFPQTSNVARRLHVRGRGLPDERAASSWWVVDGVLSDEPVADAETVCRRRLDRARAGRRALPRRPRRARRRRPRRVRRAGRDRTRRRRAAAARLPGRRSTPAGSTTATTCRASSGPAGTSPGPSATSATTAIELEAESQLPDAVAEQARRGDGWVKLVGDWIDRDAGDLAPLWPDDVLAAAIAAAHAERRPGHRARVRRGRAARADRRRASTASSTAPGSPTTPSTRWSRTAPRWCRR